ncbi:MAG: SBBP repeat-containing protein, partial [Planctomycetota bacterium]
KVGPDLKLDGHHDAFVAKVEADGTDLIYCGFIGGYGEDRGHDIDVDSEGYAYVTGVTDTPADQNFPVLIGPDLTINGGLFDAWVARVVPAGTHLDYCGYIGGIDEDQGIDIVVDDERNAYITGYTASLEDTFPVLVGPDLTYNGGQTDGFVAKVDAQGAALDFCGFIGGTFRDRSQGIALDEEGGIYLAGYTESMEGPDPMFPATVGPKLIYDADGDAFVAKLKPWPSDPVPKNNYAYCGYITGNSHDEATDIAVDEEGCAHVVGFTDSPQSCFTVVKGPDTTVNGKGDAFVARVKAVPNHPDPKENFFYCGYLGGTYHDVGRGIAVDEEGRAVVTGFTASGAGPDPLFPAKAGPDLTSNGEYDAFVAMLIADPTNPVPMDNYVYCGFVGGTDWDQGMDIAVDDEGAAYITGDTWSSEDVEGFPTIVGPDLVYNGSRDGFVAKVEYTAPLQSNKNKISERMGGKVLFTLSAGEDQAGRNYLLLGSLSPSAPGMPMPGGKAWLPFQWDGFTDLIWSMANSPVFAGFQNMLNESGKAAAQLDTLGPLPPGCANATLWFAFALNNPWNFVSNPVEIEIVP